MLEPYFRNALCVILRGPLTETWQILISPQSEEHVVIESPLGWNTDSMYSVVFQALLAEPSHSHTPGDVSSHRPSKASVTPFSPEII
ncbi:hypothetical protein PANDA_018897 [Ailuropoda melanoleuca]|uniref:Uncharacterized protein n=1 Tax=Ailuropoda melanoleuca TaxID=9646 RepID=D2I0Y3_AILME|nr:hypothetical protein PANDA_018897 [Ailuropoda melanoleuca]